MIFIFITISVVVCNEVISPANAVVMSWQPMTGSLVYGANIIYECSFGYWVSRGVYVQNTSCDNNGSWTAIKNCIGQFMLL